jgi:phosphonopyruvate decarboxylase
MDVTLFSRYDFFTGVPDSQLQPLCDWLLNKYGVSPEKHIIAANEGNAVAIAAGYHLSTGKIPVVYLQNSGIGNIINPVASLLNNKVYGIPVLFIVGWRGEPGTSDEPQHIFQGEITIKLLEDMDIQTHIINKETTEEEFNVKTAEFEALFAQGKSAAFVIRKSALSYNEKLSYDNKWCGNLIREDIIKRIVDAAGDDIIISTTGKVSRELYEIREQNAQGHERDFLTVGSMGHSSSIALGIALHNTKKRVWVIDGDGANLMHAGAMAVIGAICPKNLIHIVINNAAHESVGGIPTVAGNINLQKAAQGFNYPYTESVSDFNQLGKALSLIKEINTLCFLEVKAAVGARKNLGRPAGTPAENKEQFINYLQGRVNV